jgi:hypothetical protein
MLYPQGHLDNRNKQRSSKQLQQLISNTAAALHMLAWWPALPASTMLPCSA